MYKTSAKEAKEKVLAYLKANEGSVYMTTQQLLDSGAIPALKGFQVIPGKVSDSIVGGKITYMKDGIPVTIENPELTDDQGNPIRILVRTDRISTHDIGRG